ncbi:hypothetical protein ACTD5D_21395 [Nocardia takedensis]|uniref:hypothetical protein n=1 Tax=Nocardia takedensis TaxID=259390 RepID=UPI003F76AA91
MPNSSAPQRFPAVEPYASGLLDVGTAIGSTGSAAAIPKGGRRWSCTAGPGTAGGEDRGHTPAGSRTDSCCAKRRASPGVPGILVHGRLDLAGPLHTAWEPARAWPDADLRVIENSGHTGNPDTKSAVLAAIANFTDI